jgi:S-DNA-T family DNA segregation ATPase FtsK/SpoIIIE
MLAAHRKGMKLIPDIAALLSDKLSTVVEPVATTKSNFGFVIPNATRRTVHFRDSLLADVKKLQEKPYNAVLGTDTAGEPVIVSLTDVVHMGIFGETGSGKSVLVNSIIASLLLLNSPNELNLLLIDPKMTELSAYQSIPHLYRPVITDSAKAINALRELVAKMERRYRLLQENGLKSWSELYGKYTNCPQIVCVVDELAAIIMESKDVETHLVMLLQKSRAAGITLILCSQSPRRDVISGKLQVNIPARVALKTSTTTDSRVASGRSGEDAPDCTKLLGKGDAWYINGLTQTRFQSTYIDNETISAICNYWRNKSECIVE